MIQDVADQLERRIAEDLTRLEKLDKLRASKVKKSTEYQAYIKSKEWQVTRQRIFKRDNYQCCICGESKNLRVHHITYENLGAEKDSDLTTLCSKCHKDIHFKNAFDYLNYAFNSAFDDLENAESEEDKEKARVQVNVIDWATDIYVDVATRYEEIKDKIPDFLKRGKK